MALAAAGVGIFQYASGQSRATGLQDDWNIYALTEVLAIPILVWLSSHGGTHRLWLLGVPMLLLAVLASGSRGGLAAVAGVFIGLAWMYQRRTQAKQVPAVVVVWSEPVDCWRHRDANQPRPELLFTVADVGQWSLPHMVCCPSSPYS